MCIVAVYKIECYDGIIYLLTKDIAFYSVLVWKHTQGHNTVVTFTCDLHCSDVKFDNSYNPSYLCTSWLTLVSAGSMYMYFHVSWERHAIEIIYNLDSRTLKHRNKNPQIVHACIHVYITTPTSCYWLMLESFLKLIYSPGKYILTNVNSVDHISIKCVFVRGNRNRSVSVPSRTRRNWSTSCWTATACTPPSSTEKQNRCSSTCPSGKV